MFADDEADVDDDDEEEDDEAEASYDKLLAENDADRGRRDDRGAGAADNQLDGTNDWDADAKVREIEERHAAEEAQRRSYGGRARGVRPAPPTCRTWRISAAP